MRSMAPRAPPRAGASRRHPSSRRPRDGHLKPRPPRLAPVAARPVRRPVLALASARSRPPPPPHPPSTRSGAFARWRDERESNAPNVEVAYFGDVDDVMRHRGVRASRDLAAGDVLVELPREACLILMDDAELPFPDFCTNELWSVLTEGGKVALNLLLRRRERTRMTPRFARTSTSSQRSSTSSPSGRRAKGSVRRRRPRRGGARGGRGGVRVAREALPGTLELVDRDRLTWALNAVRNRVFLAASRTPPRPRRRCFQGDGGGKRCGVRPRRPRRGGGSRCSRCSRSWCSTRSPSPGRRAPSWRTSDAPRRAFNRKPYRARRSLSSARRRFDPRAREGGAGEEVMISYGLLGNDELITQCLRGRRRLRRLRVPGFTRVARASRRCEKPPGTGARRG